MRRQTLGLAAVLAVVAIWPVACGPKVEAVETARVVERDDDAEVLVFVRDVDGIPSCPWEVLGTVEIDDDWTEEDELADVKRAAARLGGHAVMAESATSDHVRVLRFFDPLCNPLEDRD
ncbi:MAG TPA: hypothetical protein VLA33_08745 [Gemmatimonadota bacterium]|nr:hypothetical protein [Gemmatimonadota bacterium]